MWMLMPLFILFSCLKRPGTPGQMASTTGFLNTFASEKRHMTVGDCQVVAPEAIYMFARIIRLWPLRRFPSASADATGLSLWRPSHFSDYMLFSTALIYRWSDMFCICITLCWINHVWVWLWVSCLANENFIWLMYWTCWGSVASFVKILNVWWDTPKWRPFRRWSFLGYSIRSSTRALLSGTMSIRVYKLSLKPPFL